MRPRRKRRVVFRLRLLAVVDFVTDRLAGETHGEIQLPTRRPATGFPVTCYRSIWTYPDARPQHLARVVINDRPQVDEYMSRLTSGEGVAMQPDTGSRSQLRANVIVRQGHCVIARLRLF